MSYSANSTKRNTVKGLAKIGAEDLEDGFLPDPDIDRVSLQNTKHFGGELNTRAIDPLKMDLIMSFEWIEKDLEDTKRRDSCRSTARHEAAHAQQFRFHKNNRNLENIEIHDNPRHIANAHLEAFANYQEELGGEKDNVYNEKEELHEEYKFWTAFDVEEYEGVVRPTSAHQYGRLVASLEDRANTELMDRKSAIRTSKTSLVSNLSIEDLDNVERKASSALELPSFLDLVNEEYDKILSFLDGDEYVEGQTLAGRNGQPGPVELYDGFEAADRYLEGIKESIPETGNIEDYMEVMSVVGASKAAGLDEKYDELDYNRISQLKNKACKTARESNFRNPGLTP